MMEEIRTMNGRDEDLLQHDAVWHSVVDLSSEELDFELSNLGLDEEAVARARDLLAQHANGSRFAEPEAATRDYEDHAAGEYRHSCMHAVELHYHLEATKFVTARNLEDLTVRYRDNLVVGFCNVEAHVHDNWIYLSADENRELSGWREELLVVYMIPRSVNLPACPSSNWHGYFGGSLPSDNRRDCWLSR